MKCNKGWTRNVYVIGQLVIKFPSFRKGINAFLCGCYANWMERWYWKKLEKEYKNSAYQFLPSDINLIPESLYCNWLGLFQIQQYCKEMEVYPTKTEVLLFNRIAGGDVKSQNLGYCNNKLVCFDYGMFVNPYRK